MRRAARTDDNHAEIREAYRRMGASVLDTFVLGHGAPDMFVAMFGITDAVEVKDGSKPPSRRGLTDDEKRFHEYWAAKIWIIESVDDVCDHIDSMRRRRGYG